ncbi:MAG: glutamine amidotransferase [Peptococcaceae bacterium]|nr:glutamine amidotransferase [Peptococcaceae bacterium]
MLRVCYLYPDLLNLCGNWGNMAALLKRCAWRRIDVDIIAVKLGESVDFESMDIVYLGTGDEQERCLIFEDLAPRKQNLQRAVERGMVMLAVGSGIPLLGMYRITEEEHKVPGLGLVNLHTRMTSDYLVGNCVISMRLAGREVKVVGFENHNEHTYLGRDLSPLGKVLYGHGNNGEDGMEGFCYKNVFGSNLGAVLPKNPMLTDVLLGAALRNKGRSVKFPVLDDTLEERAVQIMVKRLLT